MFGGKNIIMAVVVTVLAASAGFFTGAATQKAGTQEAVKEKETAIVQEEKTNPQKVTLESNQVVKFVSKAVSGKVSAVSGNNLTLEDGGDRLSFAVMPQARITRMVIPSSTITLPEGVEAPIAPQPETITLSQIKVGERVDATLTDQADGSFAATEITVFTELE